MEKKRTRNVTRAVTLDDLAAMVERAIAHKEDIAAIDKHLDRLDDHVVAHGVRLDKITDLLSRMDVRLDAMDRHLVGLGEDMKKLARLDRLEERFEKLRTKLGVEL